jgi:hypothetical protein
VLLIPIAVAGLATAGCNLIGAAAYKLSQEQSVPAKYTLKKDAPTVVLVENYRSPDLAANDAELLARCVQDKLDEKKVVPIVKAEKVFDLRNSRPKEFPKMTIPQIAQAVGAEQVIYVDLQSSGIGSMTGRAMFQGKAAVAVKVIDAKTGAVLYPTDNADGLSLSYETSSRKGRDEDSYPQVRTVLFDGMAKTIGRVFYPWKPSEDDED